MLTVKPVYKLSYVPDDLKWTTNQRWINRTHVLILEYDYFLSTRTRVRRKVSVLVLEYITKVIVLTVTSHDYIFSYEQLNANIYEIKMAILEVI